MIELIPEQRRAIIDAVYNPIDGIKLVVQNRRRDGISDTLIVDEIIERLNTFHSPHEILVNLGNILGVKIIKED